MTLLQRAFRQKFSIFLDFFPDVGPAPIRARQFLANRPSSLLDSRIEVVEK